MKIVFPFTTACGFNVQIVAAIDINTIAKVETTCPEDELKPALNLLGEIDEKFVFLSYQFEPKEDGAVSKV